MNPADILTEDQARVMVHLREHGPQTTKETRAEVGPFAAANLLSLRLLGLLHHVVIDGPERSSSLWWLTEDGAE